MCASDRFFLSWFKNVVIAFQIKFYRRRSVRSIIVDLTQKTLQLLTHSAVSTLRERSYEALKILVPDGELSAARAYTVPRWPTSVVTWLYVPISHTWFTHTHNSHFGKANWKKTPEYWRTRHASTSNHSIYALWTCRKCSTLSHIETESNIIVKLWVTMMDTGNLLHLTDLLDKLYRKHLAKVAVAETLSEWFHIKKGFRLGRVLSPYISTALLLFRHLLKCSDITHVYQGSDSFTYHQTQAIPVFIISCKAPTPFGWYSLHLPAEGWPGWVELGGWLDQDEPTTLRDEPQQGHPSQC